jgi:hypothetical protein
VQASDRINRATTTLRIDVVDENDNTPMFDRPFYALSVPERTPAHTSIVQVRASDADTADNNRRLTYSLLGVVQPYPGFYINAENGGIYFRCMQSNALQAQYSTMARSPCRHCHKTT